MSYAQLQDESQFTGDEPQLQQQRQEGGVISKGKRMSVRYCTV